MQLKTFRFQIFKQYLWVALFVVLARVLFRLVFDEFSFDNLLISAFDGLKLSAWVVGFGLLNAILDFRKLLPRSPKYLKTITTALNVSLALTPEIVRSIDRVKEAAKLRAHRRGIHLVRSLVVPVLSNAIDQAINLGDSMASRGYGNSNSHAQAQGDIELVGVTFAYQKNQPVLKGIDLSIPVGTLLLISGGTGSGKSTLLRVIQARYPNAGFVNQFPREGFVADQVFDELAFALVQQGLGRNEVKSKVHAIANDFELQDLLDLDPQTLSAGQQQRLAIAASLISGTKLLLLDEPFSTLDEPSTGNLVRILTSLKNLGVTVVVVEHRVDLLVEQADMKVTLKAGCLKAAIEPTPKLVVDAQQSGTITALVGPNGSGKTTHLRKLAGKRGVLVPQPASDLLFLNTVGEELEQADQDTKQPLGTTATIFSRFVGAIDKSQNPRDLSQGQKLALAISIQIAKTTDLLMLDEPTLGFDFASKATLVEHLRKIGASGVEIILATHDHEFAKAISTREQRIDRGVVTSVR